MKSVTILSFHVLQLPHQNVCPVQLTLQSDPESWSSCHVSCSTMEALPLRRRGLNKALGGQLMTRLIHVQTHTWSPLTHCRPKVRLLYHTLVWPTSQPTSVPPPQHLLPASNAPNYTHSWTSSSISVDGGRAEYFDHLTAFVLNVRNECLIYFEVLS
jgi:hypothetical protein